MSDVALSASQIEALRSRYSTGFVTHYWLQSALESIMLRVVSPNGCEPLDGEKYIIEFCNSETGEVQEVLDEDESRRLDRKSIRHVMDDIADNYLRSVANEWEAYVAQSGRCAPDETPGNVSVSAAVLQTIIR